MVKLKEVFKEVFPVIKSMSKNKRYITRKIIHLNQERVDVDFAALYEYVEGLKARFPDRGYRLDKIFMAGKEYIVLRKNDPHIHTISIYFDMEEGKVFVPSSIWRRRKKLVGYMIFRTLGALGVKFKERILQK